MAILGTKKFWKPALGASPTQKENQILKNAGYINIQLHSVNYMSVGNFWQNTFGGKDNIALTTNLKYQTGVDLVEATSVQDVRQVQVNENFNLGLQRNIAVKIPANSDALSIDAKMTAIKNDQLQAKFNMLNQPEYQSALQLAPTVVGQVLTITSLVKKLFTDSDPQAQLEASYAGIISLQAEDNPLSNGKLTKGLLIMISTNEGAQFDDIDEQKFDLRGDALFYDDNQVENTYLIFNISFDPLKGDDQKANWFKKYNDALNNLDKIQLTTDQAEIAKIFSDSKTMWIEGNALIDVDDTYLNSERIKIKSVAIKAIIDKYQELTHPTPMASFASTPEMLSFLAGSTTVNDVQEALPFTGGLLSKKLKYHPSKHIDRDLLSNLTVSKDEISNCLEHDVQTYIADLKANRIKLHLLA